MQPAGIHHRQRGVHPPRVMAFSNDLTPFSVRLVGQTHSKYPNQRRHRHDTNDKNCYTLSSCLT